MAYVPIVPVRTLDGKPPAFMRLPEDELQTFLRGTPLAIASGYVQTSAFGGSELVFGVSAENAHNLTTDGTAQELSEGTPDNQPHAVTTPVGAWVRDGKCGVWLANGQTVFMASLKTGSTYADSLISKTRYELEYDSASGLWFIDTTNSGTNDEHCVTILGMDPRSPNTSDNVRVFFQFHESCRHFV